MNGNNDLLREIQAIYNLNRVSYGIEGTSMFDSTFFSLVVVFIMGMVIFYWIIHNKLSVSKKDWRNLKCEPALLYTSGIIRPVGNNDTIISTIENYHDCVNASYKEAINEYNEEMEYMYGKNKYNLFSGKPYYDKTFKNKRNRLDTQRQHISDISLNTVTYNTSLAYNQLSVLGVYMDQFDAVIDFVKDYARNYLSYLYIHYLRAPSSSANNQKLEKLKGILDKFFSGPAFYPTS